MFLLKMPPGVAKIRIVTFSLSACERTWGW